MTCPKCGYSAPRGQPKRIDDKQVFDYRKQGKSQNWIAKQFGVTRGAIQAAIRRYEPPRTKS